jgi:hypothetical protein
VTTAVQRPSGTPAEQRWSRRVVVRDVSVSLAIAVIWTVVLLDALFGPDIVSTSAAGFTRVPSAIIVAFFAYLATRVVAKWGFTQPQVERATPTQSRDVA